MGPESGGAADDLIHAAAQDAVAAFAEARRAFDQLERSHLPRDYTVLAERLRALGEALSEVHRLAIARRQGLDPDAPSPD